MGASGVDSPLDHLGQLEELQHEVALGVRRGWSDRSLLQALLLGLAEQRSDTHRGVLQVRAGLAFEGREPVEVVHVVGGSVGVQVAELQRGDAHLDRKSTRLNSSHVKNSYAVFCVRKQNEEFTTTEDPEVLRQHLSVAFREENSFCEQKRLAHWHRDGDKNTKLHHTITKQRRSQNR